MEGLFKTNLGTFTIQDNGNGGSVILMGNAKICEFPKVAWWNLDAIEKGLDEHRDLILKRIEERVEEPKVTRENALAVIDKLSEVLGNEEKGFYASRLRQIRNKMLSA